MPGLIGANLGIIAQAVEQQLLTCVVLAGTALTGNTVVGDVSNIYWIRDGEQPKPGITGQRDILFAFHGSMPVNFQGDGRNTLSLTGMDVWLRMTLAADRPATRKDWTILETNLVDGVSDALNGFFPVDGRNNALTCEGFVPVDNSEPRKNVDTATWGEIVASYQFHVYPQLTSGVLSR
jgi:hypothetical protein